MSILVLHLVGGSLSELVADDASDWSGWTVCTAIARHVVQRRVLGDDAVLVLLEHDIVLGTACSVALREEFKCNYDR